VVKIALFAVCLACALLIKGDEWLLAYAGALCFAYFIYLVYLMRKHRGPTGEDQESP
jgi:threonine/homoserine/homoserine lactone efflux protein